ncbi:MAG: NAD(P)-binding domain-containing protein [Patescibacteria group bacterium]|nr:NAD(P)-binding domain-containing protein [Patescibacteria group bacterium]
MYYDKDSKPKLLRSKIIAIVGYGSQGHAQAQNLRDSGYNILVAELEGTDNYNLAVKHGFSPLSAKEASAKADVIQILLPDEIQDVFSKLILAHQTAFWEIVQSHTGIPSGKLEPIRKGFAALITLTSLSQKTPTQETVMSSLVPIIKRSLSIEERASLNKMKDTNISQPSPKKLNQAGLQAYRELTRILREQSVSSST